MTPYASGRGSAPAGVLEARCDALHICLFGRVAADGGERALAEHEITAPRIRAAALLTYRGACGTSRQIRVSDRHVSIIPAGHAYTAEWNADAEITRLSVKPGFLTALARANGHRGVEIMPQYACVDPFMWHLARSIEQQMRSRRVLEQSYVESLAMVIGQHLLATYTDTSLSASSPGGLPRYKIRRAIEFIRAHFKEDIGFKDIAAQLDMSPFHFARMFKESTQESPHQFIMRCRIEAAKKMLIESEQSIADIADEVGYKSQSYFTTRFARLVGLTPAAFRSAR